MLYCLQNEIASNEFINAEGLVRFEEGMKEQDIILEAKPDLIPEYEEFFSLILVNVTSTLLIEPYT